MINLLLVSRFFATLPPMNRAFTIPFIASFLFIVFANTLPVSAAEETPSIFTENKCFGTVPITKPQPIVPPFIPVDPAPPCTGDCVTVIPTGDTIMSDFAADIVGINTHINYPGTVYDRAYGSIIKPRLLELGVRHIRDNPGNGVFRERFIDLARSGIRALLVNANRGHKDYVKSINSAVPGLQVVDAVEPPNESDNHSLMGPGGEDIRTATMNLWNDYKSDPALQNIIIAGPSFARTNSSAQALAGRFPDAQNFMDVGNVHNYPGGTYPEGPGGGGWGINMQESLRRYASLSGTKPIWSTETGYKMSGAVPGHPAVSQRVAAKYFPRLFLMHLKYRVPRVYIYQLINNREDFGLLNDDGSPRLQFTSIKNFISLFRDPGAAFTPGKLGYTLGGSLTNIQQSIFQKRDGKFYLVLWQSVPSNDGDAPRRALTLNLTTKFTKATVYEPSFSMLPVSNVTDADGVNNLALSVSDQILVVELTP